MLSHLEDDGLVRLDRVKVGVCEVLGLELDEPKLGAFAGALNACDFEVQLLVRQHPPGLERLRAELLQAQPEDLPQQAHDAAESLQRLLSQLETRDGILDRRFYASLPDGAGRRASLPAVQGRIERASPHGPHPSDASAGLGPGRLAHKRWTRTRRWRSRSTGATSASAGTSPAPCTWESGPGRWRPGSCKASWPQASPWTSPSTWEPIPAEQASHTLEWQKVKFESAQSLSMHRGRTLSSEAEIALENVSRLRDEVQRGRERLFHSSLSITLHAKDEASLKEMTQRARAHFAATLGKLDLLAFRQREGLLSTLPLALNAVAVWRTLDTSSVARLYPFSPPDLDTRSRHPHGHRPAGLCPGGLRRLRRHPPQRQHGGAGTVRQFWKILRHQAGCAAGPDPWGHRLHH